MHCNPPHVSERLGSWQAGRGRSLWGLELCTSLTLSLGAQTPSESIASVSGVEPRSGFALIAWTSPWLLLAFIGRTPPPKQGTDAKVGLAASQSGAPAHVNEVKGSLTSS